MRNRGFALILCIGIGLAIWRATDGIPVAVGVAAGCFFVFARMFSRRR